MKNNHIFKTLFALIVVISLITLGCRSHKRISKDISELDTISAPDCLKKGNALLGQKNYNEALTLFNKAIELDSENGEAYSYRGIAKYNLKDYKGAIEDYTIALKLIPNYGEVYDLRGVAKGESGDKVGACEDWNKAYELGFNKASELIEKYCVEEEKE